MPCDITYMWNLKYDTNEHVYGTETDSQTQRMGLWLPRATGKDEAFGMSKVKLSYIGWINKVPLYGGSAGKRICLQCGRPRFDPWVGKIPWRREQLPTPVLWPGESRGLLSPWGRRVRHD